MRMVHKTTPPKSGTLPPTRPVPAPRTVTGIVCSLQILMICDTSLVLAGKTTTSGLPDP